jgi:flagellar hook-associated protein 1 FlgK
LAASVISEVNRIHAGGKGLKDFTNVTGLTGVIDPSLALSAADNNVAFPPQTGSFFIDVKDTATGQVVRTQIHIDLDGIGADSSLNSVAADISANVPNLTATVLADGRLQLSSASGYSFSFADDTSGALGALGINTFFGGSDALTIKLNPTIVSDPSYIAAGQSGLSGDGGNATALASLADTAVAGLGGVSLNAYYNATMADIAVRSSGAQSALDASGIVFDSLTAQREAVSGVNLDEEAVALISYQRAYQGAAEYMRVVDEMLQVLIGLVR